MGFLCLVLLHGYIDLPRYYMTPTLDTFDLPRCYATPTLDTFDLPR